MAERVISYRTPAETDPFQSRINGSASVPLGNGQEFLILSNPLILPSDASEALISLPYLDKTAPEYPYYVNHEGFILGPHKIGKHAWLVGGQEQKIGEIPLNSNTILVGNILIDPGSSEGIPYLLENLSQLGKDLSEIEVVLVTHGHLDHMEAISDLQMLGLVAPVLVPEKSVEQIRHADVKKIGQDMYQHGFNPFRIDGIITENTPLNFSGFKGRARKCPGHSEDQMYFEFIDEDGDKMFVVGDLLLGGERKEFGYDEVTWKDSLRIFTSEVLEQDEIFAGHHPTVLHKNAGMMRAIDGFGSQHWDLVPGQPGMLMSPWPL